MTPPAYRRRANDRWQVIWYEVDGVQKTRRFKAGFVTRREASRWWDDYSEQQAAPAPAPSDGPTLSDFVIRFRAWSTTMQRKTSAALEARTMGLFTAHAGPTRDLATITTADIESYLTWRRAHVAPSTANRDLVYLRKMFNAAVRWGVLTSNPTAGATKSRVPDRPVVYLEPHEQAALVTAARAMSEQAHSAGSTAPHLYPLVVLALRCGLRRAELVNLRWRDVDMQRGTITVANTASHKTKSGRERVVGIDSDAAVALQWWHSWAQREIERCDETIADGYSVARHDATFRIVTLRAVVPAPDRYVFPSLPAAALSQRNAPMREVKTSFNSLAGEVFPDRRVTLHHLRHTFAVNCARAGVPLPLITQLMGHADYKTTQIYLRFARDAGARMALALVPSLCAHTVPVGSEAGA